MQSAVKMLLATWAILVLLMPRASMSATAFVNASQGPEALATRTYFYIGGGYVDDGAGMHLFKDQMYVEKLVPQGGARRKYPIIFIHGQAQTGTNWLNTPDGRRGWGSWFLQLGYTVYTIDQTQRGRSPYIPGDGNLATYSAEFISKLFTAVQYSNLWPQARLHTQWPGVSLVRRFLKNSRNTRGMIGMANMLGNSQTGEMGDPVYDAFYASQVQFQNNTITVQTKVQLAGAALLDRVGPSILITHSQGGPLGFLIADARPTLVKALISLEPQGPPFEDRVVTESTAITRPYGLTNIPLTYQPPVINPSTDLSRVTIPPAGSELSECVLQAAPAKQLPNLAKIPQLVVTSEASFHAVYDYCTVRYLQQAGVSVDFLNLPNVGIHGNAHFVFLEKNNLVIAARVEEWIQRKI